jgi:hypothetical protein
LAENNRFPEAVEAAERGERMADAAGETNMADNLRRCAELFRHGEQLHSTQVSH